MEKSFVYGVAVTDYNFTGRVEETRRLKQNFKKACLLASLLKPIVQKKY